MNNHIFRNSDDNSVVELLSDVFQPIEADAIVLEDAMAELEAEIDPEWVSDLEAVALLELFSCQVRLGRTRRLRVTDIYIRIGLIKDGKAAVAKINAAAALKDASTELNDSCVNRSSRMRDKNAGLPKLVIRKLSCCNTAYHAS